ncbi:RNI-like protein [Rhizodiscina lignyota]|uniref:RNI-like protein n=1 Tax=Rhizodiscina lignyota TaxID=1504668 RepID=A0A9P4I7T2_9PEZI|nr:RNI-like protein [Rhizodiscina lignyota]
MTEQFQVIAVIKGKGKAEAEEVKSVKDKKKEKTKGKKRKGGSDDDDDEDWADISRNMYKKAKKLPGQLENCEICNKRFTVTPYSKTGPDGGLLCSPCGRELAKDAATEKKPKTSTAGRKRRKVESDRLDGRVSIGAKSLQTLCIEKVAQHHQDLDELGDLPQDVVERLGEIFTKRRVMKPETLKLFLRGDLDRVVINDCAYLEIEDYEQIFAIASKADTFMFNNACQFQNRAMEYMTEKANNIRFLKLYAANLVSDEAWCSFFVQRGKDLEALKLQWLDASFDDETVRQLVESCQNLKRLKLYRCRRLGPEAIDAISCLPRLEHLSLQISQPVDCERLINLVSGVGENLRTLSLLRFEEADDTLLEAIHKHCSNLAKLRITDSDTITDVGFMNLFSDWSNPPLVQVDFSSTRDVDNSNPDGPEVPVGLADEGFKSLMTHSGEKLEKLNIVSCRHITTATFMDVFDGQKTYPELREIDISFCNTADTVVIAGILKTCPKLEKLVVFGCFNVESVVVPAGILFIGAPKAQDAIEQLGNSALNVEQALGGMLTMIQANA